MNRVVFLLLVAWLALAALRADEKPVPYKLAVPAPEFPGIEAWLNSKPLTWKSLKGKVVVVHFWAFG